MGDIGELIDRLGTPGLLKSTGYYLGGASGNYIMHGGRKTGFHVNGYESALTHRFCPTNIVTEKGDVIGYFGKGGYIYSLKGKRMPYFLGAPNASTIRHFPKDKTRPE